MAGFSPIQTVDVGGLIGVYEGARDRRTKQMLLQRQIEAEDRALKRQEGIAGVYAKLRSPTKGGDPSSAGSGAAVTPPAAAPEPGMSTVYSGAGAPPPPIAMDADGTPPAAVPAIGGPAPAQPPAGLPDPPQKWLDSNAALVDELMAYDHKEAFALRTQLQSLDDAALKAAQARAGDMAKVAKHLSGMSANARTAELQRLRPQLLAQGIAPAQIDGFDPSDQNLQYVYMQGVDLEKLATIEHQERTAAETARHNRANEAAASRRAAVSEGALGVARDRAARAGKSGGGDGDNSDLGYLMGGN